MRSFTCPDCKRTSHNANDVMHSYCGNCHQFKCESYMYRRCMEPQCENFGSYDYAMKGCPEEHVNPPAWRGNLNPS